MKLEDAKHRGGKTQLRESEEKSRDEIELGGPSIGADGHLFTQ